jgi:phosphoserine aminotransferase
LQIVTTPENETPTITLPADLLPSDGRFGCGPSKVRPEAVASLAAVGESWLGTSHRQPGVRKVVQRLQDNLVQLFALPDGYEVVLGNGGSTTFWDVASFGLIRDRSQHVSYGEFSAKFCAVTKAAPHLQDPQIIATKLGSYCVPAPSTEVDTYALVHNETSTGVAVDVVRPVDSRADDLVLVDATSAAGGLLVDPTQFDCYYFAPQKAFSSDGGLWVALCSPTAINRIDEIKKTGRWTPASLDISLALDQSRLAQTYNTPALATIWLLALQVEWMLDNGGLAWAADRSETSAQHLYGWANESSYATPFVQELEARSNVVGTIDLDDSVSADKVSAILRANGIVDTESYRKLGRNQMRIGMFPSVEPADVQALTACIDYIVERL